MTTDPEEAERIVREKYPKARSYFVINRRRFEGYYIYSEKIYPLGWGHCLSPDGLFHQNEGSAWLSAARRIGTTNKKEM